MSIQENTQNANPNLLTPNIISERHNVFDNTLLRQALETLSSVLSSDGAQIDPQTREKLTAAHNNLSSFVSDTYASVLATISSDEINRTLEIILEDPEDEFEFLEGMTREEVTELMKNFLGFNRPEEIVAHIVSEKSSDFNSAAYRMADDIEESFREGVMDILFAYRESGFAPASNTEFAP